MLNYPLRRILLHNKHLWTKQIWGILLCCNWGYSIWLHHTTEIKWMWPQSNVLFTIDTANKPMYNDRKEDTCKNVLKYKLHIPVKPQLLSWLYSSDPIICGSWPCTDAVFKKESRWGGKVIQSGPIDLLLQLNKCYIISEADKLLQLISNFDDEIISI